MQTDVCIRIINEKMNIKFLVRWVFDVPAIIAFGFSRYLGFSIQYSFFHFFVEYLQCKDYLHHNLSDDKISPIPRVEN